MVSSSTEPDTSQKSTRAREGGKQRYLQMLTGPTPSPLSLGGRKHRDHEISDSHYGTRVGSLPVRLVGGKVPFKWFSESKNHGHNERALTCPHWLDIMEMHPDV